MERPPSHAARDDAVAAALDALHARQERLARGDARPVDGAIAAAATAATTPVATAIHIHGDVPRTRPPTRNARHGAKRRRIVWVSKQVQRWRPDGTLLEDVGALEFLRGATLADVRALVDQFYPLPHKRPYEFYHPTLCSLINHEDERTTDPSKLDVLALVATPLKPDSPTVGPHSTSSGAGEPTSRRRHGDEVLLTPEPKSTAKPPRTVKVGQRLTGRDDVGKEGTGVNHEEEVVLEGRVLRDGTKCDIVVRQSHDAMVSVQVRVLMGKYEGKVTGFKRINFPDMREKVDDRPTGALLNVPGAFDALSDVLDICETVDAKGIEWKLRRGPVGRKDAPSAASSHTGTTELRAPKSGSTIKTDTLSNHLSVARAAHRRQANDRHGFAHEEEKPAVHQDEHSAAKARILQTPQERPSPSESKTPGDIAPRTARSQQDVFDEDHQQLEETPIEVVAEGNLEHPLIETMSSHVNESLVKETDTSTTQESGRKTLNSSVTRTETTDLDIPSDLIVDIHGSTEQSALDTHVSSHKEDRPDGVVEDGSTMKNVEPAPSGDGFAELLNESFDGADNQRSGESIADMDLENLTNAADSMTAQDTSRAIEETNAGDVRKELQDAHMVSIADTSMLESAIVYAKTFLDFLLQLHEAATASERPNDNLDQAEARGDVPVDTTVPSSSALISLAQFQSAFLHYGVDHTVMALNGAVMALQDDLSAWSGDQWEVADLAVESYLRHALGQVGNDTTADGDSACGLRRVDAALNFIADLFEWDRPTSVRMEVIETCTNSSFEKFANLAQKKGFRLSDNERSLLSRIISGLSSDTSLELEAWLADTFEVVYFLLYRSLSIDKVQYILSREQRIKWVIQRMISIESGAWRRIQLQCHALEDRSSWEIFRDRIAAFQRKRHNQSKLLDGDVFVRAFVTLVANKAVQIEQPLTREVASSPEEVAASMKQRFVVLMKAELDAKSWYASDTSVFLRDIGLKVCELDAINKERRARGLLSLNMSGTLSARTHHHTRLLGSTYGMHRKYRWNGPDMAPWPTNNWYVFHADASIVLEYVYVRHSLDIGSIGSRWEDTLAFVEAEAKAAFRLCYGNWTSSSSKRAHVLCGVGLNVLHVGSLGDLIDVDTPQNASSTVVQAHSLSFGYHLSKNEDFAAIRITFRVHSNATSVPKSVGTTFQPTDNAVNSIDRFLCVADDDLLQKFAYFGGISFLSNCLEENRDRAWTRMPFGGSFSSMIKASNLQVVYPRRKILFFVRSFLGVVARSERTITESTLAVLDSLITLQGSEGEQLVVNAAALCFAKLCGRNDENPNIPVKAHVLRGPQRKFLELRGLDRMRKAIELLSPTSNQRHLLESALFNLLTAQVLCSQAAFMVHASLWMQYFVEPQIWLRSPELLGILNVVMDGIHERFFVESYNPRGRLHCGCGCQGSVIASVAGLQHVLEIFCKLMTSDVGRVWGMHQLRGPLDFLVYLQWTQDFSSSLIVKSTSDLVCSTLVQVFVSAHLTHEDCAFAASVFIPKLWEMISHEKFSQGVNLSCVEVIGRILHSATQLKLWDQFPSEMFGCIFELVSVVVEPSPDCSFSKLASRILFHRDSSSIEAISSVSPVVRLLCLEHERTSNTTSHAPSILESTMMLLRYQTQASRLDRVWRVPLLIFLCSTMTDLDAAKTWYELGVEAYLVELVVRKNAVEEAIIAGRILTIFYIQVHRLSAWQGHPTSIHTSLCHTLSATLREGSRRSFAQQQIRVHANSTEDLLFGPDIRDVVEIHSRYKAMVREIRDHSRDGIHQLTADGLVEVWAQHAWYESRGLVTLINHLMLVLAFSSIPSIVASETVRDEVVQILRHLLKFIRDRAHVPELQVVLYLATLTNVVSALGPDVQQTNLAAYLDKTLCQRLCVYSRRAHPLLSYLASRALSVLLVTFGDRDFVLKNLRSPLELLDETQSALQMSLPAVHGIEVLVSNITHKLSAHKAMEGDAAALAFVLEQDTKSAPLFFERYGYSTVIKFLSDGRHLFIAGPRTRSFVVSSPVCAVQGLLDYDLPVTAAEKDVIQLLRLAHSCLLVLVRTEKARSSSETAPLNHSLYSSLDDEMVRTKRIIVPLLNDPHPLVVDGALRCLLVHLTHHPHKAFDLLSPQHVDHILSLGIQDGGYVPVQSNALIAVRSVLVGSTGSDDPYQLIEKLFRNQERLVRCLKSHDFNVTKQAVELIALLVSKNDERSRQVAFAALFQHQENQAALSGAFALLCKESSLEQEAAGVLQRMVGVVLQLDLAQLIDSEVLVEALTRTLSAHKNQLFLRPLVCKCLWGIATKPDKSLHFARKSRLNAIVSLLDESLTNGEAQHIGAILRAVATVHVGIRGYLARLESTCLLGLANILGSFSRISVGGVGVDQPSDGEGADDDDVKGKEGRRASLPSYDGDARHAIRLSFDTQVLISSFTDEVYEEYLQLLLILLSPYERAEERFGCLCNSRASGCEDCDPCDLFSRAHGPRLVIRFLYARRVVVYMNDTNQRMMEAQGSDAYTLVYLALQILQILSRNHQSRVDVLRGSSDSRNGWWSVRWLIERSKPSIVERSGATADATVNALMTLSQLCAEEGVVAFVLPQREFLLSLFGHLSTARIDNEAVRCQRAATFLLSRLAEHPKITRDLLFQEKIAPVLTQLERFQDRVALANMLTLARNLGKHGQFQHVLDAAVLAFKAEIGRVEVDDAVLWLLSDVLVTILLTDRRSNNSTLQLVQPELQARTDKSQAFAKSLKSSSPAAWSRIFSRFANDDDLFGLHIHAPQVESVSSQLWAVERPSEKFLEFLLTHHLHKQVHPSPVGQHPSSSASQPTKDYISDTGSPSRIRSHSASLQYVPKTAEQNAEASHDASFAGSEQLWQFVHLLWRQCEKERRSRNESVDHYLLDLVIERFGVWLERNATGATVSDVALARRQRLLSFVNEVLRDHPDKCKLLNMRAIISLVEGFLTQSGSAHGAYELLYIMCRADRANGAFLAQHIGLSLHRTSRDSTDETPQGQASQHRHVQPSLRLLWSAARPRYFERTVPLTRIVQKGKSTGATMRVLESFVSPASTTTAFAIALLDLVSDILPEALAQYLQSQSIFVLLDVLLLSIDTRDANKRTQHILNSSVLHLLRKTLQAETNTIRFFTADPRLLQAVVYHVFSVKTSTQAAAVRLLLELLKQDPVMADRLRRLEDWETSVSRVKSWMVDATETSLARLRLTNLSRKEMVEVAHLVQVPVFAVVKTPDIARLSVAFMESRLVEHDHFMLLSGVGHFSDVPEWMGGYDVERQPVSTNAFDTTVDRMKTSATPVLVYKMQKEWYTGGSCIDARVGIARGIGTQRARLADANNHPTWLTNRLCRFLLEDRAELLRRVSYRLGASNVDIPTTPSTRWSDVLGLLGDLVLLCDISRDSLACLAAAACESTLLSISQLERDNAGVLPLILVLSDCAMYKVQVVSTNSDQHITLHGCLRRGDLFGFTRLSHPDSSELSQSQLQLTTLTEVSAPSLMVVVLSEQLLQSHLLPDEYQRLVLRCQEAAKDGMESASGLALWIASLKAREKNSEYSRHTARVGLQLHSLSIIEQLIQHTKSYAASLLNNSRLLSTLSEVARSNLSPTLVEAAIDSITAGVQNISDENEAAHVESVAIEIARDSVGHARDMAKPFQLLCESIRASARFKNHSCSSILITLVHDAFSALLGSERVLEIKTVKEVVALAHLVSAISPQEMKGASEGPALCIHLVHLLIKLGRGTDTVVLQSLLELVVLLDEDPLCQEIVHPHILAVGIHDVLRVLIANLSVLSRSSNAHDGALVVSQLRFITVFARHALLERTYKGRTATPADRDTSLFVEATRVLLAGFHCFPVQAHALLDAFSAIFEAFPLCVPVAASGVVRMGRQTMPFHRHVFALFRRVPSSRTGSITDDAKYLTGIVRCIAALSSIRRCARHFMRHGLVEISFRYLSHWPNTDRLAFHAAVWISLLETLVAMMLAAETVSANLLRSHEHKLRHFHSQLQIAVTEATLDAAGRYQLRRALAALLRLVACLQDQAVESGDSLEDCGWLVSEVVQQSLQWLGAGHSDHLPWQFPEYDRVVPLATLRLLSSACGSSELAKLCLDLPDFADTVSRLFDCISETAANPLLLESYLRFLSLIAEHVDTSESVQRERIAYAFVSRGLPATLQMASEASAIRLKGTLVLEYALRIAWLILGMLSRLPSGTFNGDLLATIQVVSRILEQPISERAVLNSYGCLSAVMDLDTASQVAASVVSAVMQALTLHQTRPRETSHVSSHTQLFSHTNVSGNDLFATRQWHCSDDVVNIGCEVLLARILHQMMNHPVFASAWLAVDPGLRELYKLGLSFALRVFGTEAVFDGRITETHSNCLSFIRCSVLFATTHLPHTQSAVWRRAARKSGFFSTVAAKLRGGQSSLALQHEIIRCCLALVKDSVVDCVELARIHECSGINMFEDVIAIILRQGEEEDTSPSVTVDCLELLSSASRLVESVAHLAVAAIDSAATFSGMVCKQAMRSESNRARVLAALFRSCRSVCQMLPVYDGYVLWGLVIDEVCRIPTSADPGDPECVVEGMRLLHVLLSRCGCSSVCRKRVTSEAFWYRLQQALSKTVEGPAREDMIALSSELLFDDGRESHMLEELDVEAVGAVEKMILECVAYGDAVSVSFCVEWLSFARSTRTSVSLRLSALLGNINAFPPTHQLALVGVLPALTSALRRGQRPHSIPSATWLTLRDRALAWFDMDDKRHRRGALTVVECLLEAKQARAIHEAVRAFRGVCAAWAGRYLRQPSPTDDEDDEAAVGIHVLARMSATLGLSFDRDEIVSRAVQLWRESAVSTTCRHSAALALIVASGLDNVRQAHDSLTRELLAEDGTGGVRLLVRDVANSLRSPSRASVSVVALSHRVALALLGASSASALVRRLFQTEACDFFNEVAWALHSLDIGYWSDNVVAACEILGLLCVDGGVARRVLERRVLHRWVEALAYRCPHASRTRVDVDRAFELLTVAVMRHDIHRRHPACALDSAAGKLLIHHSVMRVVQERMEENRHEPLLLELLCYLIQQGEFALHELWNASLLTANAQCVSAQRTILRALTDALRDARAPEDRRRAAFITYALSASLRGATPLIQARGGSGDPRIDAQGGVSMCELVAKTLALSAGTRVRHTVRVDPTGWSAPSDVFPLPLAFVASDTAVWALRVLQKCLCDKRFVRSLWGEADLFDQVLASLACPNIDVSSAAAGVLRDAVLQQATQRRITDVRDQLAQRSYRALAYFSDLRARDEIFTLAPRSPVAAALPASFAVVEMWIRFYARQVDALPTSLEARGHLEAAQEIALYLVTQHGPQVFPAASDADSADAALQQRAARARHTRLSAALLEIACAPPTEDLRRVRVLALELLTALSSFSIDLFRDADQVDRVLQVVETSRSVVARAAALHLVRALAGARAVKLLFGAPSSHLLRRLVRWLAEPTLVELQPFATAILRQVVTRATATSADAESAVHRKEASTQHHQTLVAVADALFTDKETLLQTDGLQDIADGSDEEEAAHTHYVATVTASLDAHSPSGASDQEGQVSVILHFRLLARDGACLREFRHRGKFRGAHRALSHSILLEADADVLLCDVVVASSRAGDALKPVVHPLKLKLTPRARPSRVDALVEGPSDGAPLLLSAHHAAVSTAATRDRGVLGRLLSRTSLSPAVLADAVAIVCELGKNQEVFCCPSVTLGHHLLTVMDATHRLERRVDVAPLNALTAWFWGNRSSVAHFRSSWSPLLDVIRWMRASVVVEAPPDAAPTRGSSSSAPTFLASLMEWLATLESDSLTENCVNALFFENAEVLLALAPRFYPARSAHATFFFLVATVVRVNVLHCEIFARKHAIQMLLAMLVQENAHASETLQHAARVVAKIARAGPTADKFLRHDGMTLFGRIAFLVFARDSATPWDPPRQSAADNLVLASAFLCERVADGAAAMPPVAPDAQHQRLLERFTCHHDAVQPRQLSLVEALLLYLAGHTRRRCDAPSSSARLAARVLRAWIEKWSGDCATFDAKLAEAVKTTSRVLGEDVDAAALADEYAAGLRGCLALTRWDFYGELHAVRASYSATVSAGVRTGVVPLVVRNAFSAFDRNFLQELAQEALRSTAVRAISHKALQAAARIDPVDAHAAVARDLMDVLQFVHDHETRVQTLAGNRKRHLVSRLRVADNSARVATGVHAVLSVVYDAFADALASGAASPPPAPPQVPIMDAADANRVVVAWLALLEQLFGLLCCALDELDPTYYGEVFRQLHVLLAGELPGFLLKMERVVRRDEAVRTVLTNLERVLKRLLSQQELRGVTAETEDVGQHAERLLAQYSQMKPAVSRALALALSARDGLDRVQRGIVAAEYAWRRVVGVSAGAVSSADGSVTTFMAGTAEAESLWNKLRSYADAVVAVVRHPGPLLSARWRRLQSLLASFVFASEEASSTTARGGPARESVRGDMSDSELQREAGAVERGPGTRVAAALGVQASQLLESRVPFVALESLLDHYGFASIGVKKQISLLNFTELRGRVVDAFARALGLEVAAVEQLSASELERALTRLHGAALREATGPAPRRRDSSARRVSASVLRSALSSGGILGGDATDGLGPSSASGESDAATRLRALLTELAALVDGSDLGIHLRVVVPLAHDVSLWQLLLAPVRRGRLFSAYHRMATWESGESGSVSAVTPLSGLSADPTSRDDASGGASTPTTQSLVVKSSVLDARPNALAPARPSRSKRRVAVASPDALHSGDAFAVLQSNAVTNVVDAVWRDDPLSEESLVAALRRTMRERRERQPQRRRQRSARWFARLLRPASQRYAAAETHDDDHEDRGKMTVTTSHWLDRARRRLLLALLLLAFWRQEELERDLTNAVLARAFVSRAERQDYFLELHLRRAAAELARVWMPESGSLGLPLWHSRAYFVGGSLACVALAYAAPVLPDAVFATPSARNTAMTAATYALVFVVFVCAAVSMLNLSKKHFAVQQRGRLRLAPLGKFYQNALALVAVAVEVVQLNAISFDAQFNYNDADQIPRALRWLGALGIAQIGVAQVELKAALCAATLGGWLVTLKCANKFQESSAGLNRVVTKDLPALLHGTLYMGLLSTFFSFLACADCAQSSDAAQLAKCDVAAGEPLPAPFLLSHQNVPCWTRAHAPFALLGLWGVAFFLPVGLLAQGMTQVLFAHEALDVRFAPVVTLFAQLVKALAAAARAFFPFRSTLLASVALAGNALLLALMLAAGRGGASRWYLRHVKSAVFAASGWAAACAIYRVEAAASSAVAANVVYLGWLAIGGVAAVAVRLGMREQDRDDDDQDDQDDPNDDDPTRQRQQQQQTSSSPWASELLSDVERAFLREATARAALVDGAHARETRALLERAVAYADDEPPAELRAFMRRARAFAGGLPSDDTSSATAAKEAAFLQNARRLARKMDRAGVGRGPSSSSSVGGKALKIA